MTILVPTKATGATAKTAEMTYVEPDRQVTDDELAAALPDAGLNMGGSLDVMTREMVMLQAVFLAESLDHAHWQTLAKLAERLPDGDLRDRWVRAAGEVGPEEGEHLERARAAMEKMGMLQAESSAMAAVGAKAEELVEKVRSWFA